MTRKMTKQILPMPKYPTLHIYHYHTTWDTTFTIHCGIFNQLQWQKLVDIGLWV